MRLPTLLQILHTKKIHSPTLRLLKKVEANAFANTSANTLHEENAFSNASTIKKERENTFADTSANTLHEEKSFSSTSTIEK